MDSIDVDKTIVFETMMKQTAVTAEQVSSAKKKAGSSAQSTAAAAPLVSQGVIGEIEIKFNSDLFEKRVVTLSKNAEGYSISDYLFGNG